MVVHDPRNEYHICIIITHGICTSMFLGIFLVAAG